MRLFFSPRLRCSSCHGGVDLSTPADGRQFQNTGLYERAAYRRADPGLSARSGSKDDVGKFRVPSLRNVAVTAPYMHDGSTPTLSQVIDDYAAGGRVARISGRRPARGVAVRPFTISAAEKRDLISFLESLTDDAFLRDPRFANPWPAERDAGVAASRSARE
jgi:cytochrome c peroxidase